MTHTPEAEVLVADILKAAGSNLKHHTMHKTRSDMFAAAQSHLDAYAQKSRLPDPPTNEDF